MAAIRAQAKKKQGKQEAQEDVADVFAGSPWVGLDGLEPWIGHIKESLEDLEQGKDPNGEVKKSWPGWVRNKIIEQVQR